MPSSGTAVRSRRKTVSVHTVGVRLALGLFAVPYDLVQNVSDHVSIHGQADEQQQARYEDERVRRDGPTSCSLSRRRPDPFDYRASTGHDEPMEATVPRLERRIRRDFPEPGSAPEIVRILADLPGRAGYDPEIFASERVRAAVVLLANGDLGRFRAAMQLATEGWRDLLMAAGLADEDWPDRLDWELGAEQAD